MSSKHLSPSIADLRLLRLPAVLSVVALSESRIRQLEAVGQFPKRVALGSNSIAWLERDVKAWLLDRISNGKLKPSGCTDDLLAPPRKAKKPARKAPTRTRRA